MRNKAVVLSTALLLLPLNLFSQSLFEEAISITNKQKEENKPEINGYIKTDLWGGKIPSKKEAETKSAYGEAALKLRAEKKDWGKAYSEIRFKKGREFNRDIEEINIREAYVSIYAGDFDISLGQQIVVWGRADGINPTNNITPRNQFIRSTDEDDRREGNFLARIFYNLSVFRFEGIFIPFYRANTLPLEVLPIELGEESYPESSMKDSAGALKLHLETSSFEGSVSYFDGYDPKVGITPVAGKISPKAYRVHIAGADFSTSLGSFLGLRGEAAFRKPFNNTDKDYIPNPDLHYVLGLDKEIGDSSIIVQYIGRYVFDFKKQDTPVTPAETIAYEIEMKNRLISSQTDQISHIVSCRLEGKFLQDALRLECNTVYNFTTEEIMIRPLGKYDITDAFTVTLGGEFLHGPEESFYALMDSHISAVFIEAKISF